MNLTRIRTASDAEMEDATGEWTISSLVQAATPVPAWQRTFLLQIETGGSADRVLVDEAAVLKATFQPEEIPLQSDEAPSSGEAVFESEGTYAGSLAAHLVEEGDFVHVTLGAPMRIVKLQVIVDSVRSVEFYRLDGSTPAESPTAMATVNNFEAALADNEDFTAMRFALGSRGTDGQSLPLTINQISNIWLRSYPTTPRIVLSGAEDESPTETIWISPGQVTEQFLEQGKVDAGEALAKGLQRYLDSLPVPLPSIVDVRLALESDAPCLFKFVEPSPGLEVTYHLTMRSLSSGTAKETLRFPGGQVVAREVSISLPENAIVLSGMIDIAESFRRDREHSDTLAALTVGSLAQKKGVYVGVEKWVGQKISPQTAVEASGIAIGATALASSTEMLIELQDDWEGRPSGKILAEGTVRLQESGTSGWITLLFSSPVVIPSRPYWLLAKARQGQAVWLGDSPGDDVKVLERSGEPVVWKQVNLVDNLAMLHQLFTRADAAQEQPPFVFTAGSGEASLSTNGDQTGVRAGTTHYDLTSALNSFLGAHNGPDPVTIPLTFKSAIQGFLTVYPPKVVFDIPTKD